MKKSGKRLGALLIVFVFIFTSCNKEITTSDFTLDTSQKAKVKAFFYAELDKTKQGLEFAPNGTKVFISIPNTYFNPGISGNWIDSTTINNGIIQVSVPTVSTGAIVTIKATEFTYDQIQSFGSASQKLLRFSQ